MSDDRDQQKEQEIPEVPVRRLCFRGAKCLSERHDTEDGLKALCNECEQAPRLCILERFQDQRNELEHTICTGQDFFCSSCTAKHSWWLMEKAGDDIESSKAVDCLGERMELDILWGLEWATEEERKNPTANYKCLSMYPNRLGPWHIRVWKVLSNLDQARRNELKTKAYENACEPIKHPWGLCSRCGDIVRETDADWEKYFTIEKERLVLKNGYHTTEYPHDHICGLIDIFRKTRKSCKDDSGKSDNVVQPNSTLENPIKAGNAEKPASRSLSGGLLRMAPFEFLYRRWSGKVLLMFGIGFCLSRAVGFGFPRFHGILKRIRGCI